MKIYEFADELSSINTIESNYEGENEFAKNLIPEILDGDNNKNIE